MKISLRNLGLCLVFITIFLTACQPAPTSDETETPTPTATVFPTLPAGVSIVPGVGKSYYEQVYCHVDDVDLIFDLHYPTSGEGPYPLIIFVHGGSWQMGDRRGGTGVVFTEALLDAGYAFAGINYRLAPEYIFPTMIEDVKCAVRFFRANADALNLDADRFAALGGSAGGHLVTLLGLTADQGLWEDVGGYSGVSSSVAAVVDMFGPTDLRPIADPLFRGTNEDVFSEAVFDEDAMWAFSPLAYVSGDAPPFLIIHGDADGSVMLHHSEDLQAALAEAGVPTELVVVVGGGHASELFAEGASPNLEELTEILLNFLGEYLGSD